MQKNDIAKDVMSVLKNNIMNLPDIQFTSSSQARLTTELIENVSYFSGPYKAGFIYSFEEEMGNLKTLLVQGVSYVAMTGIYFTDIGQYRKIIQFIREIDRKVKIIIGGGFFVSVFSKVEEREKEFLLKFIDADIYIDRFQCLSVIKQILSTGKKQLNQIADIIYRLENEYHTTYKTKTESALLNNNIHWTEYQSYINPITSLKTTISCPYECSFCMVKQRTEQFQHRSLEYIDYDLTALKEIGKTKIINFTDETINLPRYEFKKLMEMMIKRQYGFHWYSFFRTEQVDHEIAAMMKESGCIAVLLGMESGNDKILEGMNKQVSTNKLIAAHTILKQHNIHTIAFFIVGFPGETNETIEDTIQFINHIQPTFYKIHCWECDTGTEIWKQRDKYKLILKNGEWKHSTMSQAQAKDKIQYMHSKITGTCNIDRADFSIALQLIDAGVPLSLIKKIYSRL